MKPRIGLRNLLRLYILLSLVGAAVLSSPSDSAVPLVSLALSLYIWWRGSDLLNLAASYGAVFILPLIWEPILPPHISVLISLPLLAYIDILLRIGASSRYKPSSVGLRRPTQLGKTLLITMGAVGLLAVLVGDWALGLAVIISFIYFSVVGAMILWDLRRKPLRESKTFFRVLAGNQARGELEILNLTRLGGHLYLHSPYPWIKITPSALPLTGPKVHSTFSIVPPLAGPASPEVHAVVLDPWGLCQVNVRLQPVQLHIIPRARYAAWLAKRYLETASPGRIVSHTPSPQLAGAKVARRGGEYYGTRLYQPGDSLKVIDWKQSAKRGQLAVREFVEPYTSSPLLVVNLAVADKEEADRLAFAVITTALTLAQEGIPAAIAAYNEAAVVSVTDMLTQMELVRKALALTALISLYQTPTKYLKLADIIRVGINQKRLQEMPSDSAQKLAQFLSLEYDALKASAERNPAALAIRKALAMGKGLAQLVIISNLNHDAEALALLVSQVNARGLKVLYLEAGKQSPQERLIFGFRSKTVTLSRQSPRF